MPTKSYQPSFVKQVADWAVDTAKAVTPTSPTAIDNQRKRYGLDPEKVSKVPLTAVEGKKIIQDQKKKYDELDEELKN